jgi:DNA-binding NtrC family response regulator
LGPTPEEDASTRPTNVDGLRADAKVGSTALITAGFRIAPSVFGFTLEALDEPKSADVRGGVAQIGSDPGNDLVLSHATVSRFHCEVRLDGIRAWVTDLASTNGTLIDGVRVETGYLRPGSVIQVGQAKVRFNAGNERHPLPLSEAARFGDLAGQSPAMRSAFALLERAGKTQSTVLIEGETGTGKTRAAQALHKASSRASGPFYVVDCGAMPPALLESELFGHEKGAFTGALSRRLGVFEEAAKGTVLLDEVGELPADLQPRLLRVLESREIRRVGQNKWFKVDVRIIAATHRDLRQDVNSGRFRQDLYFRLAVARVKLPPLREHPEDIELITTSLLHELKATRDAHPRLFEPTFFDQLKIATWPGNVRELRNYLERCMLYEEPVALHDPGTEQAAGAELLSYDLGKQAAVDAFERQFLPLLLRRHDGNVAAAAAEAGFDRTYLYRLMRKHGIKAK